MNLHFCGDANEVGASFTSMLHKRILCLSRSRRCILPGILRVCHPIFHRIAQEYNFVFFKKKGTCHEQS